MTEMNETEYNEAASELGRLNNTGMCPASDNPNFERVDVLVRRCAATLSVRDADVLARFTIAVQKFESCSVQDAGGVH